MKNVWIALAVIAGIIVIGARFSISVKNGLIERDESTTEAWSQIDTQLKRRADLIPNLVSTVKGYAAHESKIFTAVAEARSALLNAKDPSAKAAASAGLNQAIGRLLAVAERYPDLKASNNFARLQDELAGTENRVAVARTRYNKEVKAYNAAIRKFPGSLFAGGMGLEKKEYFDAPESAESVPEVKF